VALYSLSSLLYFETMLALSADNLLLDASKYALEFVPSVRSRNESWMWQGRTTHFHDHLVSPEAQGFTGALYDSCRTHACQDIGLPLLRGVKAVSKHVKLIWQLRPAGRTYALAEVVACEADPVSTIGAILMAVLLDKSVNSLQGALLGRAGSVLTCNKSRMHHPSAQRSSQERCI
jgi:hypothetical protein